MQPSPFIGAVATRSSVSVTRKRRMTLPPSGIVSVALPQIVKDAAQAFRVDEQLDRGRWVLHYKKLLVKVFDAEARLL